MIKKIIYTFLLLNTALFSQSFDRDIVFQRFMGIRSEKPGVELIADKCNFEIVNTVRANFNLFTVEQQRLMKPMLERPFTQTSIVSPSGFFRIHYNSSGTDAVQYDINEFARAADSAYAFEVTGIGFLPPPADNGEGGDDLYDVYITTGGGLGNSYGVTQFSFLSGQKGPSYIILHPVFGSGFYTHGIEAARVTIAHEFNHAIQLGNYIFRSEDTWFYELTSTSFEEFVFGTVNDYYAYLKHFFDHPSKPLYQFSGSYDAYDLAIWNIYLVKKFGFSIILQQWQQMPQLRALESINKTLTERETDFTKTLNEFGIWCYYTGSKAIPGQYFDEASKYPRITYSYSESFSPPESNINMASNYTANNYLRFIYQRATDSDTLVSVITNGDFQYALLYPDSTVNFNMHMYNSDQPGSRNIGNLFYMAFSAPRESFWIDAEILNDSVKGTSSFISDADYVYPNPFRYKYHSYVYLPVTSNLSGEVDLNIYTSSMGLVYSSTKFITKPYGKPVVKWDCKNLKQEKLASGVYIYVAQSGDVISKGKIVIFND